MEIAVRGQTAYAYTGGKKVDPGLPTLLFIHGAANDHSVWQLQSRYFANHGCNALAVDLPGHGKSGGDACSSIGDYAAWIGEFLDRAAIRSAMLVGHSMGSLVAVEAAVRRAEQVEALALLGAALPMPVAEPLLDAARNDPPTAFDMLTLWSHGPGAKFGRSPSPGVALMGNCRRLLERSRPGVLHTDLAVCNDYRPAAADLGAIACPRLIVAGTHDQMTPRKAGAAAAAQMPGTRIVFIEGAGHAIMQEAPGEVLGKLRDFAAETHKTSLRAAD